MRPASTARDRARLDLAGGTLRVGEREIVLADPAMVRLYALVERLSTSSVPVLVRGPTGAGKELVAEALHGLGPRRRRRLVKLNCAAIPEHLLENELFGHERGAFTGAHGARAGLIAEAHGGTLLLDEIGEMSPLLQAKVLHVLDGGPVRRLGATEEQRVDVRIVAATHRDLRALVAQGGFREDLYYRLRASVLVLPPLCERRSEILMLADRFLARAAEREGRAAPALGVAAARALQAYAWPGNVRELQNTIAEAFVRCEGAELEPSHLPAELADGAALPRRSLDEEVRSFERQRIIAALEACGWNQTRAAEQLQVARRTLVYKIGALGIERPSGGG